MNRQQSFDINSLRVAYAAGEFTPERLINEVYQRIEERGEDFVWIYRVPQEEARAMAMALAQRRTAGESLPLFGIPFAIKDNLDVEGLPTTAACPEFTYIAQETAPAVQRLLDAGAILIGKTNLDQFATGLVGTRSPYGSPSCVFDDAYISGGSSSGSAVAVAAGLVSFSLGTDTAGSGRVPAAFNNVVGWKPTRGLLSTRGLVPACRSLDCVSVITLTCDDAQEVMKSIAAFDPDDPFSRASEAGATIEFPRVFRFGVPDEAFWKFFGDAEAEELFRASIRRMETIGGQAVPIDYAPFLETAELLYSGPWVAERLSAVTPFIDEHPDALHPVTAGIIRGGGCYSAVDTFRSFYRLEDLRRLATAEWRKMDVLLLPTTGTIYTHAELDAEPLQLNTNLGYYTNFVNLLDLCGVAVPAGFRSTGLPFGVSLFAPAFQDVAVCRLARRFHGKAGGPLGGTKMQLCDLPDEPSVPPLSASDGVLLAVVGAHLTGEPLNFQLTELEARFVTTARTREDYRLYALAGTTPAKPGLVATPGFAGPGIEVELWQLSTSAFGEFVAAIPAPLTIGTLNLADGSTVKGFLCEPHAVADSREITEWGGWRAWLASAACADAVSSPSDSAPIHTRL